MREYYHNDLWNLIKLFLENSSKKYFGNIEQKYPFYRSTRILNAYGKYTSWICFTYESQQITNGIYISIYFNKIKTLNGFCVNNVELCYGISEKNKPVLMWNKNSLPNSSSPYYRQSRCYSTFSPKDILEDSCKKDFLDILDSMIDEYKEILDNRYVSGDIKADIGVSQSCLAWVEDKLETKLTQQQAQIVQLDYVKENIDAALVVACAGCGKSTSLLGHTLHLIAEKKIIHSDDVLVVVFNKKNRKELQQKVVQYGFEHLASSIHTFHSLGLGIVREQIHHISSIDPDSNQNPFNEVLKQYTDINIKKGGDAWIKNLWRFGTDFNNRKNYEDIYQVEIPDAELREKICLLENAGFSFADGNKENDLIKLRLQNFFALYNIPYFMQPDPYPKCFISDKQKIIATIYWKQKPNILGDSDIFIENFNADSFVSLYHKLEALGVTPKKIDDYQLKRYITSAVLHVRGDIFKKIAQFFITVFKIQYPNGSAQNLIEIQNTLLKRYTDTLRQNHINAFFELLLPVYKDYQLELSDKNQIDFNDMLNLAFDYICNGTVKRKYKYILVDEFQDVAKDNFQLIQALQKQTKAKVMCVGDDWQSIYSWRGSDLEYFENFNKYFPLSKEFYISETFRNGAPLVNLAAEFVKKDKSLKDKVPISHQHETKIIPVFYNNQNKTQKWNELLGHIQKNYPSSEVLFLGRYTDDYKIEQDKQFMTIHKSKGLEKDVVVLLNLSNAAPYGFPCQVKGDIVFDTLYKDREEKAKAEERRLFYVALTRAKQACYLWIPENNISDFVKEIGL